MNLDAPHKVCLRVAATVAPAPSGAFVLGDMQGSLVRQTGLVKVVRRVRE